MSAVRIRSLWTVLLTLALAAALAQSAKAHEDGRSLRFVDAPTRADLAAPSFVPRVRDGVLRSAAPDPSQFWGGEYTTSTGETVFIFISKVYAVDETRIQAVGEFLAGLLHGSELNGLHVFLAPPGHTLCGPEAVGCASGTGFVIATAEDAGGWTVGQLLTHEYGHHLAVNRLNPPWLAERYGTKRWATHLDICARAAAGTVFPDNEREHYGLNPGEGFAEAYRVLNEVRAGATISWGLVNRLFYPDAKALELLTLDVTRPWQTHTRVTVRGAFTATGPRARLVRIATPLDGNFYVALIGAAGRARLELLGPNGAVVGRAASVYREVCGQRSFTARITRIGRRPGRFTLEVFKP